MSSDRPAAEPGRTAPSGSIEDGVHRLPVRVYYEDTDAAGIVYHADYLKFAERGRTEMLRCLGLDHGGLRDRYGLAFAVRRCVIDYHAPARLDDHLMVATRLVRLRGATIDLEQRIWRGDRLLVALDVRLALLGRSLRPVRLPSALLAPLRAFKAAADA